MSDFRGEGKSKVTPNSRIIEGKNRIKGGRGVKNDPKNLNIINAWSLTLMYTRPNVSQAKKLIAFGWLFNQYTVRQHKYLIPNSITKTQKVMNRPTCAYLHSFWIFHRFKNKTLEKNSNIVVWYQEQLSISVTSHCTKVRSTLVSYFIKVRQNRK